MLHGGSGIESEYVQSAIKLGISKINVGTEIRQAYEQALKASGDIERARESVYDRTRLIIREILGVSGSRAKLGNWGA